MRNKGILVVLLGVLVACSDDAATPADAGIDAPAGAILYLNRSGGTFTVGENDSVANTQMFSASQVTPPAYPHGDTAWGLTRDCVAALYAPFRVTVTDVDPGAVDHIEVVVTTVPAVFGLQNGVSSIAPASCSDQPRGLAVMFAGVFQSNDIRDVCEGIGAISGITYGLDWATHCPDLLTYMTGCGQKAFRDVDATCGEFDARDCRCGGTTQNSYQFLGGKLGLR